MSDTSLGATAVDAQTFLPCDAPLKGTGQGWVQLLMQEVTFEAHGGSS